MVNDDTYRRPMEFFGESRRRLMLERQNTMTRSLLNATDSDNVTEFLVKMISERQTCNKKLGLEQFDYS